MAKHIANRFSPPGEAIIWIFLHETSWQILTDSLSMGALNTTGLWTRSSAQLSQTDQANEALSIEILSTLCNDLEGHSRSSEMTWSIGYISLSISGMYVCRGIYVRAAAYSLNCHGGAMIYRMLYKTFQSLVERRIESVTSMNHGLSVAVSSI